MSKPLSLTAEQPVHFIGVGGIGMSAIAGILAERSFNVTGSDPKQSAQSQLLRQQGARVFQQQNAATIDAICSGVERSPLVVVSSAVPESNPELEAARGAGLRVVHRSELLAWLINAQRSIAVAGSHGKTTTSSLIASLLHSAGLDPTAIIGGVVPAFGSNARNGAGEWLVAEADESDGSLVRFHPQLGLITNLELDHTDHYPNLDALVGTMRRFSGNCSSVLANCDCPILSSELSADHWWSLEDSSSAHFRAVPLSLDGAGCRADYLEDGRRLGELTLPMAGIHNLSNALAAVAACRLAGAPFADLQAALTELVPPGRRFDLRGEWQGRLIVDDYAHHPSEVDATLTMAQLMVSSGRSTLPWVPKRVVAVFQPHRYSRTAQFMERFAEALRCADEVLVAPLYSAGESPIEGVSSAALAEQVQQAGQSARALADMDSLVEAVQESSNAGDLVLVMGAGDVNQLWGRLQSSADQKGLATAA